MQRTADEEHAGRGAGEFIEEFARSTPVLARADVVVVGAGPAGTMAAIAAAEAGAQVVLVDGERQPGLLAGDRLVAWVGRVGDADGRPLIGARIGGWLSSIAPRDLLEVPAASLPVASHEVAQVPSLLANPSALRCIADEALRAARVSAVFGAQAAAPLLQDGQVRGVICEQAGRRFAIRAMVTIDATGRQPSFTRAAGPFEASTLTSLTPRPTPTPACLAGPIDPDRWQRCIDGPPSATMARLRQVCGDADLPRATWNRRFVMFSAPLRHGDPAAAQFAYFREHAPGYEDAWLLDTGRSPFDDADAATIAALAASRQPPSGTRDDLLFELPVLAPGAPARHLRRRDLLSDERGALLHTGRHPDRELATRWRIGEAAGLQAALATTTGVDPRQVRVDMLRHELGLAAASDPFTT